ncbi:MAG: gamma-glutamyltransferase, partial [Actinomycetota bacterium]|nr:gamma-glutamyltransferase [Actinomycetota bacterium]
MSSARGVVAAGHPETAEAGAQVLREGGNAVDAAVCAVLTSCISESPLTGLGAGGFMLIHTPGSPPSDELVDFFVAAGGSDGTERSAELVPVDIDFGGTTQVFRVGPASCGVPGVPAGLERISERHGSMALAELIAPGVRLAREGVVLNEQQAYLFAILEPSLAGTPEGVEIYAPHGRVLREGERFRWPDAADALERLAAEGAAPFYGGEIGRRVGAW